MRRFWRKLRGFAVPLLIGTTGLACSLAASFRAYDMSAGKAQLFGAAGAVLVATCAIWLCLPKKDQPVPSLWENEMLLSVLGQGRSPVLCRRLVNTRAQGRILGCKTAAEMLAAIEWLNNRFLSMLTEIRIEDDSDLKEVAEHARLLAGLHKSIGAVRCMRFMADIQLVAAHPDTPLGKKASAIISDLSDIETQIKVVAVDALDQLFERLWTNYRSVFPLPDEPRGQIKGTFRVVKNMFSLWATDLDKVRTVASALYDEMRPHWDEDRHLVQEDSECMPQRV